MQEHVHAAVLQAANLAVSNSDNRTFSPEDIVRALPRLNANTVRTHVVSRCCVNAPKNHLHRWPYFRRVGRGIYKIEAKFLQAPKRRPTQSATRSSDFEGRDTIHAVIHKDKDFFVAECLEIAVVTQGESLDDVVSNLRQAVDLHLEGEDPSTYGLTSNPRIQLTYDVSLAS